MSSCKQLLPCMAFVVPDILQIESFVLFQVLAKLLTGILASDPVGQDCSKTQKAFVKVGTGGKVVEKVDKHYGLVAEIPGSQIAAYSSSKVL